MFSCCTSTTADSDGDDAKEKKPRKERVYKPSDQTSKEADESSPASDAQSGVPVKALKRKKGKADVGTLLSTSHNNSVSRSSAISVSNISPSEYNGDGFDAVYGNTVDRSLPALQTMRRYQDCAKVRAQTIILERKEAMAAEQARLSKAFGSTTQRYGHDVEQHQQEQEQQRHQRGESYEQPREPETQHARRAENTTPAQEHVPPRRQQHSDLVVAGRPPAAQHELPRKQPSGVRSSTSPRHPPPPPLSKASPSSSTMASHSLSAMARSDDFDRSNEHRHHGSSHGANSTSATSAEPMNTEEVHEVVVDVEVDDGKCE